MADTTQPNEADTTHGSTEVPAADTADLQSQAEKLIAEGKKAIALKQWEEGVAKYADALDLRRQLVGEFDPSMAPLLLSYGKALYELAFSQAGVMGKEEVEKQAGGETIRAEEGGSGNFVFSADPVSDDDEVEGDGQGNGVEESGPSATRPTEVESEGDAEVGINGAGEEAEEVDEPEDDYNAAWEVLDVARTIYSKMVQGREGSDAREDRLNLAECYLALGDVSCETENFTQAVQDYTSALEIKSALLPSSARSLASVHYQLATVLEFTPNRRADALKHVESAVTGFKARLAELASDSEQSDEVKKLSEKEKEKEVEDVKALIGDLEVKIEELKAAPPAEDLVSESINHLLGSDALGSALGSMLNGSSSGSGGPSGSSVGDAPVNDLTSMVKRKPKKAPVPANGSMNKVEAEAEGVSENGTIAGVKRSAESDAQNGDADKKVKLE
ncbi:hypothetical protein BD324DRAFT_206499 [Kockovaella imperatae]|uniref:Tetratricopeptide SHNi-TPR domain-containing protein n=1 Tax=Kockovaella imperatae TaxID=4999 RepID=A0A1Y1U8Q1_9TREE|nr:hypothetical protein BD324DRAFT_206499 [Kockovaella imperatae]ORX33867.1 hypothetical protein BD324DRAFT_206499 [Kockovaella imperatae]